MGDYRRNGSRRTYDNKNGHSGYGRNHKRRRRKPPVYKQWWFWTVGAAVVVFVVIVATSAGGRNADAPTLDTQPTPIIAQSATQAPAQQTASPTQTPGLSELEQQIANALLNQLANAPEQTGAMQEGSGTLGSVTVEILDAYIATDYEGRECAVVNYRWTHSEDEPISFRWAVSNCVYQNGIELETAYIENITEAQDMNVQAGATQDVACAYVISDRSPISIELEEFAIVSDGSKVVKTIELPQA